MACGFLFFIIGLLPLAFIIAFCSLEIAISFIQAQVFVVLTSSYIKDALELHGGSSSSSSSSSKTKVGASPNLYTSNKLNLIRGQHSNSTRLNTRNYSTKTDSTNLIKGSNENEYF
jgi:MFS superfamily sulfate permease-like transporter